MAVFGLRSLSELVTPPNIKYKENALCALEEGVVVSLKQAIEKYGDDTDVVVCLSKIIWGIVEGLLNEDATMKDDFVEQEGIATLLSTAASTEGDDESLSLSLQSISNLSKLSIVFDSTPIVPGLLSALQKKMKPDMYVKLINALMAITGEDAGIQVCSDNEAIKQLLSFCKGKIGTTNNDELKAVEEALVVVYRISQKFPQTSQLPVLMDILDGFNNKKAIADRGSIAMTTFISSSQLKDCLKKLSSAPGTPENQAALTMLSSLSYVSQFADEIVQGGGIPQLTNAIKSSAPSLKAADQSMVKGLVGACKMLTAIANKPANTKKIVKDDGVVALVLMLENAKSIPPAAAASMDCLSFIVNEKENALAVDKLKGFNTVLSILNSSKDEDVLVKGTQMLENGTFKEVVQALGKEGVTTIASCQKECRKNVKHQVNCISILGKFADVFDDLNVFKDFLPSLAQSMSDHSDDVSMARAGMSFYKSATKHDKANLVFGGQESVDTVLELMITHKNDKDINSSGMSVLEVIATKDDVDRTNKGLQPALKSTKSNIKNVFKSLAAVAGLTQVPRLASSFDFSTCEIILSGIESWVSGPQFAQKQQLITTATGAVEMVAAVSEGSNIDLMKRLFSISQVPSMKKIIDSQDIFSDNSLTDLLHLIENLVEQKAIKDESEIVAIVDGVMAIMKKYHDLRKINVCCIRILASLCDKHPLANQKIMDVGACKSVIAYMQRVVIYDDVQEEGFRLLHKMLKVDPSLADGMRRNGATNMVKAASKRYSNNAAVKKYMSPVMALLMPVEELEREIIENTTILEESMKGDDMQMAISAASTLNQLTVSMEGSKIASRVNVARVVPQFVTTIQRRRKAKPKCEETTKLNNEFTQTLCNIAQTKYGCQSLVKNGVVGSLVALFEDLAKAPNSDDKVAGLEANLECTRRLMRFSDANSDIVYKKGLVSNLHLLQGMYEDNPDLMVKTAQIYGAFKNPLPDVKPLASFVEYLVKQIQTNPDKTIKCKAVEALEALLLDPNSSVVDIVVKAKGLPAIMKAVNDYADDPVLRRKGLNCLDGVMRVSRTGCKFSGKSEELSHAIQMLKTVCKEARGSPDDIASAMAFLAAVTDKSDAGVLEKAGLIDLVMDTVSEHPNDESLNAAAGSLLKIMGADEMIKRLLKRVKANLTEKPADWRRTHMKLMSDLAVFIGADVEKPEEVYKDLQGAIDLMADSLKELDKNQLPAVTKVTRKLAEKYSNQLDSQYGFRNLQPKMVGALIGALEDPSNKRVPPSKKFLCDTYETLATASSCPSLMKNFIKDIGKTKIMDIAFDHLKEYQSDPEVVASVMKFMACVADNSKGLEQLVNSCKTKKSKNFGDDFCSEISALIARHRMNGQVAIAGLELLAQVSCPYLQQKQTIQELSEIAKAHPDALPHFAKVLKKNLKDQKHTDQIAAINHFRKLVGTVSTSHNLTDAQRAAIAAAEADLLAGLPPSVLKSEGMDNLDQIVEESKNSAAFCKTTKALKDMACRDSDVSAKITRDVAKICLQNASPLVQGADAPAIEAALSLLATLTSDENNARALGKTQEVKDTLVKIEALLANRELSEPAQIQTLLNTVKKNIQDSTPEEMTLKKLHEQWSKRVEAGESLDLKVNSTVMRHVDFLFNYTEEYSMYKHSDSDRKKDTCMEFYYGCKCLELLHAHAENTEECLGFNEGKIILSSINRMKGDHTLQWPVDVAICALQHDSAKKPWSEVENAAPYVVKALEMGRKISKSEVDRESMLIKRLLLMEKLAVHRKYFNGTAAMKVLIGLWDECDANEYSIEVLIQVFSTMRMIVNDHFLKDLEENNVPGRLVQFTNDKNSNKRCLRNVLFLLGILAMVPSVKTKIGELMGIEACLGVVKRYLKEPSLDAELRAIPVNACLALANLTIAHGPNIKHFFEDKGVELNITVLQESLNCVPKGIALNYDQANSAAILIANTCFKRNDMKEIYGKKGAVQCIMQVIQKYDGQADQEAFRCLGAMFKAIANLALFAPNIEAFCQQHVENTFTGFFEKSANMPDWLVEIAARTVSNLVLENTEKYMTQFGKILAPMLRMMQTQEDRTSIPMYCMAFDVFGMLSRLGANSKEFIKLGGVGSVLRVLNSNVDEKLYSHGIFALGIQATDPEGVAQLVKYGVFTFLTSLFENQTTVEEPNRELCINALRCCRRIIQNEHIVKEFVKAGGVEAVGQLLGLNNVHPMVHMDGHRVLIACLAMSGGGKEDKPNTKTNKKSPSDPWDDSDVGDELEVKSAFDLLVRPSGPRGWELLSLSPTVINKMIQAVLQLLEEKRLIKNLRMIRCALGLLAYFACEKVPGTVVSYYQGNVTQVLTEVFREHKGDSEIIKTGCYLLNNVALASDPDLYLAMRQQKELRETLADAVAAMQGDDAKFCSLTLLLINERSLDTDRFASHAQWNYPLDLTLWDQDKYPNGVQDLPAEIKDMIRLGDKVKVQVDENSKDTLWWKASLDMGEIEWQIGAKEGAYSSRCSVSSLTMIARGAKSELFQSMKGDSKLFNKRSVVVQGPACEGHPTGFEWNLIFSTPGSAETFYTLLTEWREAAAFGFNC